MTKQISKEARKYGFEKQETEINYRNSSLQNVFKAHGQQDIGQQINVDCSIVELMIRPKISL